MRNKTVFDLMFVALYCGFAFMNFGSVGLAQGVEKPRSKDFGSSLKSGADKKDEKAALIKGVLTDEDVIKVETTLVVTDFLVLDKQGRSINNLNKTDFVVTEDTVPQQIEAFSLGDDGIIGRSIVLIMDYSGTLLPYIETSVEAAKILVDKLKPADKMAIVTDNIELLTDFTRDKALLKDKLETLKKAALEGNVGRSKQYSALIAALNELFDDEDVRPIIIFQTDGDEFSSLKGNFNKSLANSSSSKIPNFLGPLDSEERNFTFQDVLSASDEKRVTIYTIIPGVQFIGVSESEFLERGKKVVDQRREIIAKVFGRKPPRITQKSAETVALISAQIFYQAHLAIASVAKHTGGWTEYLETPEQANAVYSRVLAGINKRYVVGYYPTNQARDGKRRKVAVTVRNHPEYTVWGRKTYIAPEQ